MRYIVKRYYRAGNVEYQAGQVIEIDDPEYAAWLNRDMRGYLEEIAPVQPESEPEERAPEAPPADRMMRRRKGAHGGQGAITRDTFKAVRD